jgi:trehalose-phosphatase
MGEPGRPTAVGKGSIAQNPTPIPKALENMGLIEGAFRGNSLFAAFDFDGTLEPIHGDPESVFLSPAMKARLEALSRVSKVAVVTGRDLRDIRRRVGLADLFYSGCHGFEISGPPGSGISFEIGEKYLPALEEAGDRFEKILRNFPGAILQRKRFCLSAHYRLVNEQDVPKLIGLIERAAAAVGGLRARSDKKAVEVLPDMDWNKGSAVLWLLDFLGMTPANSFAIYVGDDVTDEDGFRAVAGRGAGVIVTGAEPPERTRAIYRLDNVSETGRFIERLTRIASQSGGI